MRGSCAVTGVSWAEDMAGDPSVRGNTNIPALSGQRGGPGAGRVRPTLTGLPGNYTASALYGNYATS
jgi:hypothetical protein